MTSKVALKVGILASYVDEPVASLSGPVGQQPVQQPTAESSLSLSDQQASSSSSSSSSCRFRSEESEGPPLKDEATGSEQSSSLFTSSSSSSSSSSSPSSDLQPACSSNASTSSSLNRLSSSTTSTSATTSSSSSSTLASSTKSASEEAEVFIEPTKSKKRKMGNDLDLLNDSGIPMDGVELDSSTATRGGSNSIELVNSSDLTSSSSKTNVNSSISSGLANENSRVASTTTTTTSSSSSSLLSSTNLMGSYKSKKKSPEDNGQPDGSGPVATDNEAVACPSSPSLDCVNEQRNVDGFSPDFVARGSNNEPLVALARQVYQMNNLIQAETPNVAQNQSQLNIDKRQINGVNIKNFGDLFDDEDLD